MKPMRPKQFSPNSLASNKPKSAHQMMEDIKRSIEHKISQMSKKYITNPKRKQRQEEKKCRSLQDIEENVMKQVKRRQKTQQEQQVINRNNQEDAFRENQPQMNIDQQRMPYQQQQTPSLQQTQQSIPYQQLTSIYTLCKQQQRLITSKLQLINTRQKQAEESISSEITKIITYMKQLQESILNRLQQQKLRQLQSSKVNESIYSFVLMLKKIKKIYLRSEINEQTEIIEKLRQNRMVWIGNKGEIGKIKGLRNQADRLLAVVQKIDQNIQQECDTANQHLSRIKCLIDETKDGIIKRQMFPGYQQIQGIILKNQTQAIEGQMINIPKQRKENKSMVNKSEPQYVILNNDRDISIPLIVSNIQIELQQSLRGNQSLVLRNKDKLFNEESRKIPNYNKKETPDDKNKQQIREKSNQLPVKNIQQTTLQQMSAKLTSSIQFKDHFTLPISKSQQTTQINRTSQGQQTEEMMVCEVKKAKYQKLQRKESMLLDGFCDREETKDKLEEQVKGDREINNVKDICQNIEKKETEQSVVCKDSKCHQENAVPIDIKSCQTINIVSVQSINQIPATSIAPQTIENPQLSHQSKPVIQLPFSKQISKEISTSNLTESIAQPQTQKMTSPKPLNRSLALLLKEGKYLKLEENDGQDLKIYQRKEVSRSLDRVKESSRRGQEQNIKHRTNIHNSDRYNAGKRQLSSTNQYLSLLQPLNSSFNQPKPLNIQSKSLTQLPSNLNILSPFNITHTSNPRQQPKPVPFSFSSSLTKLPSQTLLPKPSMLSPRNQLNCLDTLRKQKLKFQKIKYCRAVEK